MMKRVLRWLLRFLYGFEAFNEEVLKTPGPVLLLPNHVSWWDWLIIGVCLDEDWRFVTSSSAAETSWVHKRIMVNKRTFPVNVNSPYAVKHMAEFLQRGGRLVMFPEGRISWTGALMKLFDGTGFLALKTEAKVLTAYIRGANKLPFSRNPDRKHWFPKLSVHFSDVHPLPDVKHVSMSEGRHRVTDMVYDRMLEQQLETEMKFGCATIEQAILETAREHPGKVVLEDVSSSRLTYRKLFTGANVLARQWEKRLGPEVRVGVLLPNVNATPVTLLSLWSMGKVPAVLNYTAGPQTLTACARVAGLKQVITSRVFVVKAGLDLKPLQQAGVELIYLEEVRKSIGKVERLMALMSQMLRVHYSHMAPATSGLGADRAHSAEDRTAVILFTSGSEGEPKAVELSHRNLLANVRQMLAIIDLSEKDRFFNALPLFHSFGLSVATVLPLIRGSYIFLYVSPLHYKIVPSALYDLRCTVFFGTNTFLAGYARKAHPYDFHTVRYCYGGAEKVQESTSAIWMEKFGVRVLEGYGATECSPVVSANTPMRPLRGSAGHFVPGVEHRMEPVAGVPEGGRLFVRGPNIMKGYLNPEPNAKFKALNGWYDTGDIVKVDEHGFVHILGRLKRFAKVSGEMVSLGAVEEALSGAFPEFGLRFVACVIARPDEAKGEKLVLVCNDSRLTLDRVREVLRARGVSNLATPREVRHLHDIPRLGTGKVDYRSLDKLIL